MKNKKCTKCKKIKSIEEFGIYNRAKDGLNSHCLQCKRAHQNKTRNALGRRLNDYRISAKKRGFAFNISKNEFKTITEKRCIYCGEYSGTYNDRPYCGIDRVNSNEGYIKKNVVSCCLKCNMMKGTLAYNEFINHIIDIYNNLELDKGEKEKNE